MKQKHFCEPAAIRFKHFSRKGYSLFACLGRVVVIGTLSVPTLSHARAEGVSIRPEVASDTLQRSELKLDEVVVTGSRAPLTDLQSAKIVSVITRDDIQRVAAASINDILKLVPGVDVRQRGDFGVQTDISVRGGNFDQITILLNGVNISSPHTGHLTADFPVSPDDIERIEVLEGPAARVYGTQAFNGVINIVTVSPEATMANSAQNGLLKGHSPVGGYVNASGGQYGYANANGALSFVHPLGDGTDGVKNAGTTLQRDHLYGGVTAGYSRSDGATPNSFYSSTRAFFQGGYRSDNVKVDAQVGYSYKPYGANTFYGASSTDQWESNERWMAAQKGDITIGNVGKSGIHLTPQLFWNRWFDHYQWHRNQPGGENFHKVDNYGGSLNAWFESMAGKTSIGVEVKRDGILSTKLGEIMPESDWVPVGGYDVINSIGRVDKATAEEEYPAINYKFKDGRTNVSAFLEHNILLRQWTVSLGLLANRNTGLDSKFRFYPGVDIAYRPTAEWKLYASWNMALRMPTFTDLYYSGAGIEGNRDLKPEKTSDLQLGARYGGKAFAADVQLFYSHKSDMIDWVKSVEAGDDVFHSVNFLMDNVGVELNATFSPRKLWGENFPLSSVNARYSYIYEDSKYDVTVLASKYAMDYLRHKVVLSADGRIWRNLNMSLSWRWQDRSGSGNKSYALLDGRLSWDECCWSVYLQGNNILDARYFDYLSIPQTGIWLRSGAVIRF